MPSGSRVPPIQPKVPSSPRSKNPGDTVQLGRVLRTSRLGRQGIDQRNVVRPRRDYLGNALGLNRRDVPVRLAVRVARYAPGAPALYHDVPRGFGHNDMIGRVWMRWGPVRLWWQNPLRQLDNFAYTGSRVADIAAANAIQSAAGYTWHHCANYANGAGTLQLVPTAEHGGWGHWGGVEQARAAGAPAGFTGAWAY